MNSLRLLVKKSVHQYRHFHKCTILRTEAAVAAAAAPVEPLTIPNPENEEKAVSQKIDKIAKEITALNLIEVAELSNLLKKRLNLPDAPVMPVGGFAVAKKEEQDEAPKAKTAFSIKLIKFDDKQKVPLIKEIKNMLPDMNLVQAKKFVESAPVIVTSDVPKEKADEIKANLEKVGGVIELS